MEREMILAVDIGGSKYVVGLVSDQGEILCKRKYSWRRMTAEGVTEEICGAMAQVLEENPGVPVRAVGMTIPGLADPERGIWLSASFMGIYDLPVGGIVRERFGLPVYLDNDCNACALAEKMYGCCGDTDHFLYMTVSNSIGGALFVNGRLYRGARGNAGEVGNIRVDEGLKNSAGRRDSLENYASGRGLAATYLKLGGLAKIDGKAPDGVTITRLADQGDPVAQEAFRMEGRYLGQAIAACCALLDPEKVIIGGGLSLVFDRYRKPLFEVLEQELAAADISAPQVRTTALGYDGGLLGAASLAVCGLRKTS